MLHRSLVLIAVAQLGCGDTAALDSDGEVVTPDAKEVDASDDLEALEISDGEIREPEECPWVAWDEGLIGGRVDLAAFDPRLAGLVLASSGGSMTRSLDAAATFVPWAEGVALRTLAFPPGDLKVLLAGTNQGLYGSDDSGRTFEPQALGGLDVRALLVHPALPQRVFAGIEGAILRSDDGGHAFRSVNVGVPRMIVESLVAPADEPDVVLATGVFQNADYGVGNGGVILRSSDGGASWTAVSDDLVWGTRLAFCPVDARHVVAAVRRGALVSHDAGVTWTRMEALGGRDVLDVAFAAPSDGSCTRLWASVYREGVYRLDGDVLAAPGLAGLDLELGRFAGSLAPHPEDPQVVLTATHAGLFRSGDAGASWTLVETSKGLSIVDVADDGERTWMTTWGNGLWTRDRITPWRRVAALPSDFTWLAAPLGDQLLIGSANDVWVAAQADPAALVFTLAPGLNNATDALVLADELLVTTQIAGLQRSVAPTSGWTASNAGLEPFSTSAGTFIDARSLVADPTRPDRLYMALRGAGVAVSDDRGGSWVRPANALTSDAVLRLLVDVQDGAARLYALVDGKGVWVSSDGAATWTADNRGLDTLGIGDLVLDPTSHRLYASVSNGGVVMSDDGLSFTSFAIWCLPVAGWGALALVTEADGSRWLVATSRGNRVLRHRLD